MEKVRRGECEKAEDRLVYGCWANNEALPFLDDTFDCYLSNLSLQTVDNYRNMLSEALRVVKKGSSMAFSVWGRKDKMHFFDAINVVLERHGLGPKEKPKKTNYDLGKDPEGLKKQMLEMGFSNIRMWY